MSVTVELLPELTTVILAGTLRPSPLHAALGVPAPCLPVGPGVTLLEAWQAVFEDAGVGSDVRVVVNSEAEVDPLAGHRATPFRVIVEPAAWRGTAGVLRDVTDDLDDAQPVLVVEASCLPPLSLRPLLDAMDDRTAGVVGVGGFDEPGGVYVLRRDAIASASTVGYRDFKEQLLPALHEAGSAVRTADLGGPVHRVWDRRSYLHAVQHYISTRRDVRREQLAETRSAVSGTAIVEGFVLLGSGAVVEDGAVVHESIILDGATVGGGAVVSRSIVGPLAQLAPRTRVVRRIVDAHTAEAGDFVDIAGVGGRQP